MVFAVFFCQSCLVHSSITVSGCASEHPLTPSFSILAAKGNPFTGRKVGSLFQNRIKPISANIRS